ncbi:MAG: fatty acid desaturase [Thermoleophilaceae bacterium]|nr:fatty acid desaturase [Thermoleophilaceae bacterium]
MSEAAATDKVGRPFFREDIAPYAQPHMGRSVLDLLTSVLPYLLLTVGMYLLLDVSYWWTLLLAIPAAGFLLRTYIVFHDCTHGSFMKTKRANAIVGTLTGLLVWTPFLNWRHSHAVHHATAGDLDRRGEGDVPTYTVAEYFALPRKERVIYYIFRSPFGMFVLGPIVALIIQPRLIAEGTRPRLKRSVHLTNLALLVMVVGLALLIGPWDLFLVWFPVVMLAGASGVWLFYVQHQYEDAYWENHDTWNYADSALRGSSYLKLPKILQFFTGNIGLHHVHHLSARVPNYNLQAAHDGIKLFEDVPVLTFWDGIKAVELKVYDEEGGKLVGWREARRIHAAALARGEAAERSAPPSLASDLA